MVKKEFKTKRQDYRQEIIIPSWLKKFLLLIFIEIVIATIVLLFIA